ncbi:MAG: STAS domain-containing protein, partial [Deltaproteobacteria bacterium]|nr:STAS domain-containing protein [Deltaproteobacteria bacterium]
MMTTARAHSRYFEVSESGEGGMALHLWGRLDAARSSLLIRELDDLFREAPPQDLTVDLSRVTYLDDFGVLVLVEIKTMMARAGGGFRIENADEEIQQILKIFRFESLGEPTALRRKRQPGMMVRLGDAGIRHAQDMRYLISFVGSVFLALLHVCLHPRSLRTGETINAMQRTGVDALPIVSLISFLLGLIMAFMSAVQLKQFGANI